MLHVGPAAASNGDKALPRLPGCPCPRLQRQPVARACHSPQDTKISPRQPQRCPLSPHSPGERAAAAQPACLSAPADKPRARPRRALRARHPSSSSPASTKAATGTATCRDAGASSEQSGAHPAPRRQLGARGAGWEPLACPSTDTHGRHGSSRRGPARCWGTESRGQGWCSAAGE